MVEGFCIAFQRWSSPLAHHALALVRLSVAAGVPPSAPPAPEKLMLASISNIFQVEHSHLSGSWTERQPVKEPVPGLAGYDWGFALELLRNYIPFP